MARKDDDIFRKLSKQKPLVKRSDLQPLSSRDFAPRTSAGSAKPDARKNTRSVEPPRFAAAPKKPALKSPAVRGADLANRYNQRQGTAAAPRQGLTLFGEEESTKETARPVKKQTVETATPATPRTAAKPAEPAPQKRPAMSEKREPEKAPSRVGRKAPEKEKSLEIPAGAQAMPEQEIYTRARIKSGQGEAGNLDVFSENTRSASRERAYGQSVQVQMSADQETELSLDPSVEKGLSFRHELKYYINYHDYVLLKNTLKPLLSLDRNAGMDGDYHIRSLYFDDVYETALAEKMAGYDIRHKYRIRIYDFSDNLIKFEKKMKKGQYIAKTSLLISRAECDALMAGDCSCLEGRPEPLAAELFLQMKNDLLKPRVIVDYRREAYVSSFENVRITFDKDLKAGLWLTDIFNPNAPTMPVLEPGTMVLEVKFNRYLPVFIKAVLNNVNAAQRSAVSKYVLCRKYE